MLKRALSLHLSEPKFGRSKLIKIWANGDSQCYEFNINPRNFRSWIAILVEVTDVIKPYFGAVRKLLALSTMQVVECFEDLDQNERYIALGSNCKFKQAPGGYKTNSEKESFLRKKSSKKLYDGSMNSKAEVFLMETKRKNLTIVYMVVNGKTNQTPEKIVFNENDMKNWDIVYKYLSKILDLPEGINKVCTIFGQVLTKPIDFQHGFLYVAVPSQEQFIMKDYASCLKGENKYRSSYTLAIRPASMTASTKLTVKPGDGTGTSSKSPSEDELVAQPVKPIPEDL